MSAVDCHVRFRVWVDGCFDFPHYGHSMFLRLAKSLGDYLVVGVHADADVRNDKGIVFTKHEDRIKVIQAVRWVDEIVKWPPTKTSLSTLDSYGCWFCVHGDDPVIDKFGVDSYAFAKNVGRYRETRRIPGISTTDLIGRLLWITDQLQFERQDSAEKRIPIKPWYEDSCKALVVEEKELFSSNSEREPKQGDKVVYTSGSFDLFHAGHVDFLRMCKQQGDFLIVGIYSDEDVSRYYGKCFPAAVLRERFLALTSCRYVDKVILEAPYILTAKMLDEYKIDHVTHGKTTISPSTDGQDPYAEAKARGIFSILDSGNKLTLGSILEKVSRDKSYFEERNVKKREQYAKDAMRKKSQEQLE